MPAFLITGNQLKSTHCYFFISEFQSNLTNNWRYISHVTTLFHLMPSYKRMIAITVEYSFKFIPYDYALLILNLIRPNQGLK